MLNFSWLSDEEDATLRAIASRDWRSDALRLGESADEELAARGVALGAIAGHGFGKVFVGFARRAAAKDADAFAQRIKVAVEAS